MIYARPDRKFACRFVNVPPPEREPRGRKRDQLFAVLAAMKVGGEAVEVNRKLTSMRHYVYRFRVASGRQLRFLLRCTRSGSTLIWRVQ